MTSTFFFTWVYYARLFLGRAAVLLRAKFTILVIWVLLAFLAKEVDILDILRGPALETLVIVVKVVIEEAVAEGALLEVVVLGARVPVGVLPELPQVLIRSVYLILELAIAFCSSLGEC